MATTLDSLSAADRADFLKRLAVFGLDGSSVLQPDLVIPPKSVTSLSTGSTSFLRPHVLTTSNLDELKSWIGIPDRHFQQGLLTNRLEAPVPFARTSAIARLAATPVATATAALLTGTAGSNLAASVASRDLDNLRTAAVAYIWGDSSAASQFKPVIEGAFKNFQVFVWPFLTITVSAGAVLELGSGPHVLCAWKIIIQEGGQVRGVGTNLNVQCTILEKAVNRIPVGILSNTNAVLA